MASERVIANSDFERRLIEKLTALSVQVEPGFRVKTDEGRYFMADLFISSPERAIVEIKSMIAGPAAKVLRGARMQMEAVRRESGGQIRCILVLIGLGKIPPDSFAEDDWLEIIEVSGNDAPVNAAFEIRDRLFGSLPAERLAMLSSEELADPLLETGPLADVLVSFRTRISDGAFEVLRLEAKNLNREYESGHYTTSALCVGRMLEFVVYTLATDWRVPINKRTIGLLEGLESKFNLLSTSIIDYAYAEGEQERDNARAKLRKDIADFNASVTDVAFLSHEDHERKTDRKHTVNIQSIIRDIRKRHARIEAVRKEIDFLKDSKLIDALLDMRNRAAHANTSGTRTEYEKHDIDGLIENLRAIFFHLGNIADAIEREGR